MEQLVDMSNKDALIELRPWYRYIQVFDSNGRETRKIIATYHPQVGSRLQYHGTAKEPSFVVTKSHSSQTFHLEICSPSLRHQLLPVCLDSRGTNLSFRDVVQGYLMLKQRASGPMANAEIHLLVHDFLSCPKLHYGINQESVFRQTGIGGVELEKDIHAKRVHMGLNNLDFLFVLGQTRESSNPEYLSTFRQVFDRLVDSGDVDGLHRVCEPLVVTGKIEWRHSDEILIKVLETGNLELFRYILDLATRTQPQTHVALGYPDCTFHPLYMAIRLGHLETVERLLELGYDFDGFCRVESNESQHSSIPFNSITAAAYWGQTPVLRLLLRHGIATQCSLQTALNMAQSRGHQLIVQELQHTSSLIQGQAGFPHNTVGSVGSQMDNTPGTLLQSVQVAWNSNSTLDNLLESSHSTNSATISNNGGPSLFENSTSFQTIEAAASPNRASNTQSDQSDKTSPNLPDPKSQVFGSRLSSALQAMCFEVQSHAFQIGRPDLTEKFRGFGRVWERGMATIRLITRNKAPKSLRSVLDCLLVAAAITKAKEGLKNRAFQNFASDFECWRSAVPEKDRPIFDSVTKSVWGPPVDSVGNWRDEGHTAVQRFHYIVDKLVFNQDSGSNIPLSLSDSPLPDGGFNNTTHFSASSVPQDYLHSDWDQIGTGSFRRSLPQISGAGAWAGYSNPLTTSYLDHGGIFPHSPHSEGVDKIHGPPTIITSPAGALPLVTRLLGSVAIGVVFSMLIILQIGGETSETRLIGQERHTLASACAILSKFVDIFSGSMFRPLPTIVTPPTDYLSVPDLGGLTPSTAVSSECPTPSPVTIPLDASALHNLPSPLLGTLSPLLPSMSQGFMTPDTCRSPRNRSPSLLSDISASGSGCGGGGTSPSEDDPTSPRPRSEPCTKCGRTFSSVTNLRKHLRDKVCLPGSKSRFACRNIGCERLLSTRWYRHQHEEQYCQLRRPQLGPAV